MRIKLFLLFSLFSSALFSQCDVSISSWDAASGDITIEAINSENCGCNDFTTEGNTCEYSGSPHVNNNTTVSHIVLGLHSPGLDYNWLDCISAVNHPGWTFKVFTLYGNQVLESGDTWGANVYDYNSSTKDCWAEMLSNDTLCTEVVVWQINLSRTAFINDGGWATMLEGFNQTQNYPDVDLSNNTAVNCALPACDTVYVDIETIEYVNTVEYLYDTIVLVETDTLIELQYIYLTDTMYVETVVYEYIYVYNTDTITEFVAESIYIDCETGETCDQSFPCDESSIFAPNAVTPNGDGWNDFWMVIADGSCWGQWETRIYNRWGDIVWISASNLDEWDANVAAGVYVYTITAHSSMNAGVFEFNGTITVLY
jgi:gliding motility-associated-like protein